MSNPTCCCESQFVRFARGQLRYTELEQLEFHIEKCGRCQRRLDESVAEMQLWNDVRDLLPDDEYDTPSVADGGIGDAGTKSAKEPALRHQRTTPNVVSQLIGHLRPTDDPSMLGRIGQYEVIGVIGAGGMGVVLKCLDKSLNRFVAIKVLAPHLAHSGAARQRFAREAQAAAAVIHDNVIAIFGVEENQELPYLVMPYERGISLQKRLEEAGSLEVVEVLRIALQTASGLAAAHAQGLVHRDVKPANILLSDGVERVKITDFGLARAADDASLTQSGVIAGTPQYMSPEQARGEPLDARSDLFSLGSVLYAMCVGHPPFRAETSYGVLRRITDDEPTPILQLNPAIPQWLCALIERLHAKSRDGRYDTAHHLARDLQLCLAHLQQPMTSNIPLDLQPPHENIFEANDDDSLGKRPIAAGIALRTVLLVTVLMIGTVSVATRLTPNRVMKSTSNASDNESVSAASAELTEQETRRAKDEPRETRWDDDVAGLLVDYQRGIRDLERQLSSSTDTESLTPHFAY